MAIACVPTDCIGVGLVGGLAGVKGTPLELAISIAIGVGAAIEKTVGIPAYDFAHKAIDRRFLLVGEGLADFPKPDVEMQG